MMKWFDMLFPPALILTPLVITLCIRPNHETDEQRDTATRLMRFLVLGTIGAIGIWLIAYLTLPGGVSRHFWPVVFPLFALSSRIMPNRNVNWQAPHPDDTVRVASLKSRQHESPIPTMAWAVPIVLAVVFLGALLARWTQPFETDSDQSRWWIAFIVAVTLIPMEAAMGPWIIRLVMREPEPMDLGGSKELSEEYRRNRNARAWMFYIFLLVMLCLAGISTTVLGWIAMDAEIGGTIGLVGGIVGSVIGILGATAGVYFSFRRARINGMMRELMQQQSADAAASN